MHYGVLLKIMEEESYYCSTEIIIKSDSKCEALIDELMNDETAYYTIPSHDIGEWYICIDPAHRNNAEDSIRSICDSIENLSSEAQIQWKQSIFKEFFIGYKISQNTPRLGETLSHKTIQRVSELGAGIGIAMYPVNSDES